jgi:zinc finger SWIM domain-containing protein 3
MSIKLLPPQYVIKRWTREAHSGTIQDKQRINIIENPIMDALLRCRYMSNKFLNLAYEAAKFPQCTMLVDSTLDILCKQIEEMIITCPSTSVSPSAVPTDATPSNDVLSNARLKKKEVEIKTSKRKRNWLEKKPKARKKSKSKATTQEKNRWYDAGNNSILMY